MTDIDVGPLSNQSKVLLNVDLNKLDDEKYVKMLLAIMGSKGLPEIIKRVVDLDYEIVEC